MRIADALAVSHGTTTEREILLARVFGQKRTWVLAHPEIELDEHHIDSYSYFCERLDRGEPVAYIVGHKEFFGREFLVDSSTLIPRPATELLVEQVLDLLKGKQVDHAKEIDTGIVAWVELWKNTSGFPLIADIGTGSGCIAITLACELPTVSVIATDISADALAIAQKNAERHRVANRITCKQGSGLDPLQDIGQPFLIVSNPPYIPERVALERNVQDFEPQTALFAGEKGTDVIDVLVAAARAHPFCAGFALECRREQAKANI